MCRPCVKHSIHMISFNPHNHPDFIDEKRKHGMRVRGGAAGGVGNTQHALGCPAGQWQRRFWKAQNLYSTSRFTPTPSRLTLEGAPGVGPIA